jgi:hypothetical protein
LGLPPGTLGGDEGLVDGTSFYGAHALCLWPLIYPFIEQQNLYNYIQTRKVYGKCTEHEMCVLMSSTVLAQNSLRSGKCSVRSVQKTTAAHLDHNLECCLIVSDLNGKEIGWTFSEHLTNVKFHNICSALFVLAHACIRELFIGCPDSCEHT